MRGSWVGMLWRRWVDLGVVYSKVCWKERGGWDEWDFKAGEWFDVEMDMM